MGSSQKVVKGIIWTTLVNIVNAAYSFISVPLLIQHFGKSQYGLIGLAMSINVYMNLMDMGFNSTNVRFFSTWLTEHKFEKMSKAFQTSLSFYGVIGFVNAIVLLVISFFSGSIFNVTFAENDTLKHLLYILSIAAFCNWFSSCFDQMVKSTENIEWIQKRTLFTKVLMIGVLASTILFGFSIELYLILTLIAQLCIVPLSINKIKKELPFVHFMPKFDKGAFMEMLPYSLNIFSFSIFQFSFYNLRPVFLGIQGTMDSVADYRILNGIISLVTMLGGAFVGVLLPSTSKLVAEHNRNAYYKVAYDGTKYISILINFCCFGMMSVGTEILTLYVGKSYLYLIPWFNLWLICTLVTHNQAISSLILAGSDIRAITYSSIVASVLGLITTWLLIPYYLIGGTVIGFIVYNSIQILFYYLYYWPRKMHINSWLIFRKDFIPFVILGVGVYYVTKLVPCILNTFMTFIIKGCIFFILYIIGTWIISSKEDKKFFKKLVSKNN